MWNDDTAAIAPYQTTLKQAETIGSIEVVIPSWIEIVKSMVTPAAVRVLMNDKPTLFHQSRHVHYRLGNVEAMFDRAHIKHDIVALIYIKIYSRFNL